MEFTFVHAADLHLGSPFQGLAVAGPEHRAVAERLREATFAAFSRLVDLCVERGASFLLLAGDTFDDEECSVRDVFRFRDGLVRLRDAGIAVLLVHGNHDPADGRRPAVAWPENTRFFGTEEPETAEFENLPGVTVTGVSYRTRRESRKLARLYRPPDGAGFHVALLHANVGGDRNHEDYSPCTVEQLREAGFHYWALGHVHERRTLDGKPAILYPGNLQGRHARETGERGALVVRADTETGRAEPEFVPLQEVRWERVEAPIGGLETMDALDERLGEAVGDLAQACRPAALVVRLRLVGRGPLNAELRREGAAGDLCARLRERWSGASPFVWIESLRLACGSEIDFAARRGGDDLAAEILRRADALAGDAAWQDAALADLFQHRRGKPALDLPEDELRAQLLREAAEACVEALDEGEA